MVNHVLTIDDFLSLDFMRPETCKDLSPHQLLPVWRVMLRVCSLVVLTLDITSTQSLKPSQDRKLAFHLANRNLLHHITIYFFMMDLN